MLRLTFSFNGYLDLLVEDVFCMSKFLSKKYDSISISLFV